MSLTHLLDTSTVSRLGGQVTDQAVQTRFRDLPEEMAIASVVWHELLYGLERLADGRRKRELADLLNSVVLAACPVLPYDEAAATWHATERARLARIGLTPPFRDGQIAATAFVHGLTLVTANARDFEHFAGLSIEDWSTASP